MSRLHISMPRLNVRGWSPGFHSRVHHPQMKQPSGEALCFYICKQRKSAHTSSPTPGKHVRNLVYGLIIRRECLGINVAQENPDRPHSSQAEDMLKTLYILVKKQDTSKFQVTSSRSLSDPWSVINYGQPACEVHENKESHCIIGGVTNQLTALCRIIEHHLQLISIDNKGWGKLSPKCCSFYRNSKRKRTFGSFSTQAYIFLLNVTFSIE